MRQLAGGRRSRVNLALGTGVALAVIALDQWTKTLAAENWRQPVHLLGPLSFRLAYNSGVAFSIGTGLGLPIVLVALVALGVFAFRRRHQVSRPVVIGASLVAGGALSNLGDRLFRGHNGSVVDFIYTTFWPTFNLADSAVVVGCAVLFVCYWRSSRYREPDEVRHGTAADRAADMRGGRPPMKAACAG